MQSRPHSLRVAGLGGAGVLAAGIRVIRMRAGLQSLGLTV